MELDQGHYSQRLFRALVAHTTNFRDSDSSLLDSIRCNFILVLSNVGQRQRWICMVAVQGPMALQIPILHVQSTIFALKARRVTEDPDEISHIS